MEDTLSRRTLSSAWHIAVLSVVAVVCAGCWTRDIEAAHAEMLQLRGSVREGMTPGEIEDVFKKQQPAYVRYAGTSGSVVIFNQTVPDGRPVKEWVLWISLREGKAAAVRIRTNDSAAERPTDAPEDLIWKEEDPDTPFRRQASR
jgi:hypothetical protein